MGKGSWRGRNQLVQESAVLSPWGPLEIGGAVAEPGRVARVGVGWVEVAVAAPRDRKDSSPPSFLRALYLKVAF